jgi:hypothetical protein
MEEIIHAVFTEISNCSHPEHGSSRSLRACLDAKAESLARTALHLFENANEVSGASEVKEANNESNANDASGASNANRVREEIKELVRQAIHDCGDSLDEIGYDSPPLMQQCLLKRSDRLVDMAVDLIAEDIPSENYVVEIKKHRCSRKKKSVSRRKKKSARKIRWKK